MIRRLLLLSSVFCLLAVGSFGCASSPDKKDKALTAAEDRVPAYFEEIPATTPYVFTSLEPFPMEVLEPYMKTYAEMYDSLSQQMKQQQQQYNYQPQRDPGEEFMLALFEELSKARSIEGYKQLGLSTRPQAAIYGIGWFPVMRVSLGNAKAFEGMLSRLETKAGLEVQMRQVAKQTYRQYDIEDEIKIALAITDSELIVGFAPTQAFDEFVAYMLGQKKPARSLADVNVIQDIQAKYSLLPYAVGYADIVGIAGAATGAAPADEITASMLQAIDYKAPQMTEVCRGEYMSIFEKMPRVVMGYTELSPELMEVTAVLETEGGFAKDLAQTAAPMPAYSSDLVDKSFFAVGLGVDVQKMIGFLNNQAARINQDPFQCPDFAQWNQAAQQATMYSQLVPPFVSSLRGAMAVVTDVQLDQQSFQPQSFDAVALVESGDPMTLLSQMQMYIPHIQGLSLKPNGVPSALKAVPDAPWLQSPHMAMDKDTLAASAGVGMQDEMAVLLEGKNAAGAEDTPLMLIAYDYGKFMDKLAPMYGMGGANPMGGMFSSMQKMFGTFVGEVDATDDGIVLRYRLNMFPPQGN
ncbi:hypothetical protein FIV42_00180 [Persicimonas caeni]|uniref:DUF3352 domain-containing protein n=1 Tax=Persicimonas caeni TaxID=2292766 RepID=A0A4Y6PLT6_PERCE|nr:hypothetical protein [Persicimonas caeni]QDG49210.1 hypothetical protein FIV42_00180 [Persicimonas caeni]QED30431.1 hypothetical protein FRD00_00175 [Persicimonas caeni]